MVLVECLVVDADFPDDFEGEPVVAAADPESEAAAVDSAAEVFFVDVGWLVIVADAEADAAAVGRAESCSPSTLLFLWLQAPSRLTSITRRFSLQYQAV